MQGETLEGVQTSEPNSYIHCFHILCRLNKNYILQYNIYMLNFSFSSDNTIFERKLCIEKY